ISNGLRHQLSALMGGSAANAGTAESVDAIIAAANDDQEQPGNTDNWFSQFRTMMRENWQPLSIDATVCLAASVFAISLVS
ncbi:MAG: hypothetical protein AAF404_15070, partial [Pseudomonadota bacterium]